MTLSNTCRASLSRIVAILLLVALLLPAPAFSLDSEDSQVFIAGFNAYQKRDYQSAIENLTTLLKKYPDTSLKDMGLFWLARAHYKAGHQQEAAKNMAQFLREYPDSPLKATVEDNLVALAERYEKGEPIPSAGNVAGETAATKQPANSRAAERAAAERAAAERLAAEKAAAENAARERAAADSAAAERAAAKRAAAEKVAAEQAAVERAAADRATADRAAAERAAAERAAAERAAAERAAAERAAAERGAAERAAAERAAAERAAAERAAAERAAAERAAAERAAAERAATEKIAAVQAASEKNSSKKSKKKGKKNADKKAQAVAQASQRPVAEASAAPAPKPVLAQVLTLEVEQFGDLDLQMAPMPEKQEVGQTFTIPIDIVNTGNGSDSFNLDSDFPREYDFHFAAPSAPALPIKSTPTLAAGEKLRVLAVATVPPTNIDGQRISYPVKIGSNFSKDVSKTRQITFVSSAPLVRAVVKTEKRKIFPGEKITYRISILNIGTAPANRVFLKINYSPAYEPEVLPEGMKQEGKGALVLNTLPLKSGESRDFNLTFLLKDEALADEELFLRADLVNRDLNKKESYLSPITVVQKVSGVAAKTPSDRLVVIPGQVITVPVVLTNTGNIRDTFGIKVKSATEASYVLYEDVNRDGKRQANEPLINVVGPLAPKEEAYVLLEVATPASAKDGSVARVALYAEPDSAPDKPASVNVQLAYSRPILDLSMTAPKGGKLKPGEVASLELDCINHGSNPARQVTLQSVLPAQLELVASDPAYAKAEDGTFTWRFDELGAGEKRNIKVTYRVKPGIAVGTNMQVKHLLSYQDLLGNRY